MASLIKDSKSGIYHVQFYDRTRRPKRKTVSLKTRRKRTATRIFHKLEDEFALGSYDPWRPPEPVEEDELRTVGESIEAYLQSCSHLKPKTITTYEDVLFPFERSVGSATDVRKLTPQHIVDWIDSTDAGAVTRRKYVNHLGYLFRFLVKKKVLQKDLSKEVLLRRVPEQAPKAMTPDQVQRLVQTIRAYSESHADDPKRANFNWLADLILFNVHVGLRRGELIHLRWRDVNAERKILRVTNSAEFTTKTVKERTIPLSYRAVELLDKTHDEASSCPYVFSLRGKKLNHNTLTHYFRRFRRRARLPDHFNLHSTRHTFATWLAEKGTPILVIQQLMGHSTVKTTERYMSSRADISRVWMQTAFDD